MEFGNTTTAFDSELDLPSETDDFLDDPVSSRLACNSNCRILISYLRRPDTVQADAATHLSALELGLASLAAIEPPAILNVYRSEILVTLQSKVKKVQI